MVMTDSFPENLPSGDLARLDGSWEQSNRSLNTAAVLGLLGIGVLYFNGQSFLVLAAVGLKRLSGGDAGSSFDSLLASFRSYVGPLRVVVLISQFGLMLVPTLILVKRWHSSDVRVYLRLTRGSLTDALLAIFVTMAFSFVDAPSMNEITWNSILRIDYPRTIIDRGPIDVKKENLSSGII